MMRQIYLRIQLHEGHNLCEISLRRGYYVLQIMQTDSGAAARVPFTAKGEIRTGQNVTVFTEHYTPSPDRTGIAKFFEVEY